VSPPIEDGDNRHRQPVSSLMPDYVGVPHNPEPVKPRFALRALTEPDPAQIFQTFPA
jgi:hypothetical protein